MAGSVGEPGAREDPHLLAGWGRTSPTAARVARPADAGEVAQLLGATDDEVVDRRAAAAGIIARGLGRSYGDAAQSAGGVVVSTGRLKGIAWSGAGHGMVDVGAGVSVHELLAWALPQGWFVPVTPGTRYVTVGGAIAADVHGKNHHRDGSFCRHVRAFELVTPTGTRLVGPDSDPELFWATAGAMGLTGVVTRATVAMVPVETAAMVVDTIRFDDLDAVMASMEESDRRRRYSVAWVDCSASGRRLGRAVLTLGEHARAGDLPVRWRAPVLAAPRGPRFRVPFAPPGLLRASTVRAFNEAWFRRAPPRRLGAIEASSSFFHPLDALADWNLLYGRRGFVQYQFVVPPEQAEALRGAVRQIGEARLPAFLAVLKRFGPGDPGPLSFPSEGWTLALDFPVGPPSLPTLLDRLDRLVAEAGGRVYLAKDARLAPELVATMYPRLPELVAARRRVDPAGRLRSDLSRRLGLDGEPAPRPRGRRGTRQVPSTATGGAPRG